MGARVRGRNSRRLNGCRGLIGGERMAADAVHSLALNCDIAVFPHARPPLAVAALSLLLAACAGRTIVPDTDVELSSAASPTLAAEAPQWVRLDMQMDGSVPRVGAGGPLFSSGLSLAGLGQSLQYSAGYEVKPGDVWAAQDNRPPQSYGSQNLHQHLQLRLPAVYGAPLLIGAETQQQESFLLNGEAQQMKQTMDLQWAPGFAALRLVWMPEGAAIDQTQALRCDVAGQVSIPLLEAGTRRSAALDAGARSCAVVADAVQPSVLSAQTWSAGFRWGAPRRETSVRVLGVAADTPTVGRTDGTARAAADTAYEVRLAQQRELGDWQARADVAWRRAPTATETELRAMQASPWAASAELSRRLAQMRVAASWKRGDPYWFLSEVQQAADRFALTLDLSSWASSLGYLRVPSLAMSYQWSRLGNGDSLQDDQSINWNVSFPWR